MEALSVFLVRAKELGEIHGFEKDRGGEAITHLQFADDTILFNSTRREELLALKRILRCFQLVSGLNVKLSKSLLVGVGRPKEMIRSFCGFGSL